MRISLFIPAFFIGSAWAQIPVELDAHSIVVSASNTVVLPPTQISFFVSANADPTTTLSQILTAIGFNLTANDLTGVSSAAPPGPPPTNNPPALTRVQYTFRLSVPIAQMADTMAKLQSIAASNTQIFISYSSAQIGPSEAAAQQAQQAILPDLIATAQKLAASVAAAAQLRLGRIEAINPSGVPVSAPPGLVGSVLTFSATVRFAAYY
jgi:hypothetical protein